jgi:hypothetical protein
MSEDSRERHGLIFKFRISNETSWLYIGRPFHNVGHHSSSRAGSCFRRTENFGDIFVLAIYYLVCASPLFSFFTSDAHLFVTALYVLKLRNGGNPLQVRNVDNEYVELSNLQ